MQRDGSHSPRERPFRVPRSCSICTHPGTAEITKALTSGDSVRGVASRFGVTYAAAHRHLQNCLKIVRRAEKRGGDAAQVSPATASRFETAGAELDPRTLLARASRLMDDVQGIIDRARTSGDDRLGLQAQRELRESLNLCMRAVGMLSDGNTINVNVDQRKQYAEFLGQFNEDAVRALQRDRCPHCDGSLAAALVSRETLGEPKIRGDSRNGVPE